MEEQIRGPVTAVLSDTLIQMLITQVKKENDDDYNPREIVKLATLLPEEGDVNRAYTESNDKKAFLEKTLLGKEVICHVQKRDKIGKLVVNAEIVEEE